MHSTRAFTLIELMVVVAIVALLAAYGVPAFQDYLLRSKVVEGITAARPWQVAIVDNAVNGKYLPEGMPPNATFSGTSTFTWTQNLPKSVKSLSLNATTGWITITYQGGPIDSKTLLLAPKYREATGSSIGLVSTPSAGTVIPTARISWTCRSADIPGSGGGSVFAVGTLPGRFAPPWCTEPPLE